MSKAQVVEHELSRATAAGACRLTTSWRNASGHGVVTFAGRQLLLHRLVLEVRLGRVLAEGEQANHACHRPACINPDHLYVGSQKENVQHYSRAGLAPARRLTARAVSEIRRRHAEGASQTALGREFRVTQGAIHWIVKGVTWPQIRDDDEEVPR